MPIIVTKNIDDCLEDNGWNKKVTDIADAIAETNATLDPHLTSDFSKLHVTGAEKNLILKVKNEIFNKTLPSTPTISGAGGMLDYDIVEMHIRKNAGKRIRNYNI